MYIDIHCHTAPTLPDVTFIRNLQFTGQIPEPLPDHYHSVGIHPWDSSSVSFDQSAFEILAGDPGILAIGECGIDRLQGASVRSQQLLFIRHALLAEQFAKPLIIHCVRAWDEIAGLRREMAPSVDWIIHGFRGKRATADRLIEGGFHLSFGESLLSFNPVLEDILRNTPDDRLFLESDDGRRPISDIYDAAVRMKGLSLNALQTLVKTNFERVFKPAGASGVASADRAAPGKG